jgi:hypothetical protein
MERFLKNMGTGLPLGRASRACVYVVSGLAVFTAAPETASADSDADSNSKTPFRLRSGTVEIGAAGALSSVEGDTRATVSVLSTTFRPLFGGLAGLGGDAGYTHVNSLDVLELEAHATWQKPLRGASVYPFLGVGGGLRQEWLGSFRTARYPLGIDSGFRVLLTSTTAIRTEYRWRRILGDPVADFSEHRLLVGVSLLFSNEEDR